MVLVQNRKTALLLYGKESKLVQKMKSTEIKDLINGQEPIAIVRYFEWTVISKNYCHPRYLLLKLNTICKDIEEVHIPGNMVSFLVSKLDSFQEVFRRDDGTVWERMAFRDKVKEHVPRPKINHFIRES